MTGAARDDQAVSDSGGTMTRLTGAPRTVTPDLRLLDDEYRSAYDDALRPAGGPPYAEDETLQLPDGVVEIARARTT